MQGTRRGTGSSRTSPARERAKRSVQLADRRQPRERRLPGEGDRLSDEDDSEDHSTIAAVTAAVFAVTVGRAGAPPKVALPSKLSLELNATQKFNCFSFAQTVRQRCAIHTNHPRPIATRTSAVSSEADAAVAISIHPGSCEAVRTVFTYAHLGPPIFNPFRVELFGDLTGSNRFHSGAAISGGLAHQEQHTLSTSRPNILSTPTPLRILALAAAALRGKIVPNDAKMQCAARHHWHVRGGRRC